MTTEGQHIHHECVKPPEKATEAGAAYFRASASDFRFFHFLIDVVLSGDYFGFVAEHALAGNYSKYEDMDPRKLASSEPGPRTRFLRDNRQLLLEMFLARLVDNFQKYLVDLVRAVLHARPAMLSSRQQTLTLEEVLKYERIDDLVHTIIERRVNALTYEGFAELRAWCSERGLDIEASDAEAQIVVELIATRNLIAHNRGVVDERYTRMASMPRFQLGEVRKLEVDDWFEAIKVLASVVERTDTRAVGKFQLATVAVPPERAAVGSVRKDGDTTTLDKGTGFS